MRGPLRAAAAPARGQGLSPREVPSGPWGPSPAWCPALVPSTLHSLAPYATLAKSGRSPPEAVFRKGPDPFQNQAFGPPLTRAYNALVGAVRSGGRRVHAWGKLGSASF